MEFLRVSESVVAGWLAAVESSYHSENYYHNSTHAADVLHASAYFLQTNKLKVSRVGEGECWENYCHKSTKQQ